MELTSKRAILFIIATMIIGGTLGYFAVEPFALENKNFATELSIGLDKIKNEK